MTSQETKILQLLHEVSAISKKYELLNQKTGGYFNVFDIVNVATHEVPICRVMYELLSPTGDQRSFLL